MIADNLLACPNDIQDLSLVKSLFDKFLLYLKTLYTNKIGALCQVLSAHPCLQSFQTRHCKKQPNCFLNPDLSYLSCLTVGQQDLQLLDKDIDKDLA